MRRNSFFAFLKEKSFLIVLTLMLVSAGTMAALFSIGRADSTEENQTAQQESVSEIRNIAESAKKEPETESTAVKRTTVTKKTDTKEKEQETTAEETQPLTNQAELEDQFLEAEEMAEASGADVIAEGFSESPMLTLQWPVEGEVLMDFSMDHSVYFETLAQYQYNPAMIISAEEGTAVTAAAAGTVTEVGKSSEFGHYVTMDVGNGYEITYGQLFDITTEVGEALDTGAQFAMVCFPTRSYSAEGDNLYFKVTHNGTAVDPALYLN